MHHSTAVLATFHMYTYIEYLHYFVSLFTSFTTLSHTGICYFIQSHFLKDLSTQILISIILLFYLRSGALAILYLIPILVCSLRSGILLIKSFCWELSYTPKNV